MSSEHSGTLTGHGVRAIFGGRDAPGGATVAGVRGGRHRARPGRLRRDRAVGRRGVPGAGRLTRSSPRTARPATRERVGRQRRGRREPSRASRPTSASTTARPSASRSTPPPRAYRLDIYRMGYYGGLGARQIATVSRRQRCRRRSRPASTDAATGLVDCGNWAESRPRGPCRPTPSRASTSPSSCATDGRRARATSSSSCATTTAHSDLLFQTSDTTWQAYNKYGGNSLYTGLARTGRAYKVSYNRPFTTRGTTRPRTGSSTPSTRWSAGSSATATTSATRPASTPTAAARAARAQGRSCRSATTSTGPARSARTSRRRATPACTSRSSAATRSSGRRAGSTSIDGRHRVPHARLLQGDARRTRRSTRAGDWTGTWRDPRFSPPADGGRPENAPDRHDLHGQLRHRRDPGPGRRRQAALLAEHPRRDAAAGRRATLADGTLGYEWDEDLDNGVAARRA